MGDRGTQQLGLCINWVTTRQSPPSYLMLWFWQDEGKETKYFRYYMLQTIYKILGYFIIYLDKNQNTSLWYFVRSRDRNVLCRVTDVLIGVEHWADTTKNISGSGTFYWFQLTIRIETLYFPDIVNEIVSLSPCYPLPSLSPVPSLYWVKQIQTVQCLSRSNVLCKKCIIVFLLPSQLIHVPAQPLVKDQ